MSSQPLSSTQTTLTIDTLGTRGDGVGQVEGQALYVPYTLPGETVIVESEGHRGVLKKVLTPSPERRKAPCPHFGKCGGCALQHMTPGTYQSFKTDVVIKSFAAQNISLPPPTFMSTSTGQRRRCSLSARRTKKTVLLGYHSLKSKEIYNLDHCLLLHPRIEALLLPLKNLIKPLLTRKQEGRIAINLAQNGPDIAFENVKSPEDPALRQSLADMAFKMGLCRLSINGVPFMVRETPVIELTGGSLHELPVGSFLQANPLSEKQMNEKIAHLLGKAGRSFADLFSGIGTFSFPAARFGEVSAFEHDRQAVESFQKAILHNKGRKKMQITDRDLYRHPLNSRELRGFDVLLFDPPRSGAPRQTAEIANSNIPLIIAVSCNPATLARDARYLIDGGYRLEEMTLFDQFLYSAHIEQLAVFRKD